jgi:hypothetical protein
MAEQPSPVSSWAQERFGSAAPQLRWSIPAALHAAHRRALAAHLASKLETNDAYGIPLAVIQHQEMVARLESVEGVRTIRPKGSRYALVRIGNVVLYPWRYASDAQTPVEQASLRQPVSALRKDLFTLGTSEPDSQLTLDHADIDDAVLEELWEAERDALVQLGWCSWPKPPGWWWRPTLATREQGS